MTMPFYQMEILRIKSEARAAIVNQVAAILWTNGEQREDCEDGSMPSWDEVVAECGVPDSDVPPDRRECHHVCWQGYLAHQHRAEELLSLSPADSMTLAKILLDSSQEGHRSSENDLWAKIERAKGFEPGSLRGWPGVKQQVAI